MSGVVFCNIVVKLNNVEKVDWFLLERINCIEMI